MGGESTIAERWLRFTGIVGDTLATDYVLAPSTATTMISMLVYVYRHVIPHWTSLDIDMYSGHNESLSARLRLPQTPLFIELSLLYFTFSFEYFANAMQHPHPGWAILLLPPTTHHPPCAAI